MIRLAQVVRVNQARRSVDLVYLDTREPVREALVAGKASNVGGAWDVPSVPLPVSAQATGQLQPSTPSMVAVVADVDGHPVVLGFVPALGNQVAVTEANLEIDRHPSGVVQTIEADGSIQTIHPGGATIRLGSATLLNPAAVSADGNWKVAAGAAPTLTVSLPGLNLVVTPAGAVTLTANSTAAVTINGAVTVNAPDGTTWIGPFTLDGALQVNSTITATGDVVAGAISLEEHAHTSGADGSPTSAPIPGT